MIHENIINGYYWEWDIKILVSAKLLEELEINMEECRCKMHQVPQVHTKLISQMQQNFFNKAKLEDKIEKFLVSETKKFHNCSKLVIVPYLRLKSWDGKILKRSGP